MLGKFWEKKTEVITSPVVGRSIPIEKVSDKVFAEKLLGDGIAFIFEGDTVYAPCSGEIIMIADTRHAFGIRTANGTEILLHVGTDTVNLKGEGLELLVSNHTKIRAQSPILRIDRKFMQDKNIDLTTPMIISNMDEYDLEIESPRAGNLGSVTIKTRKKE